MRRASATPARAVLHASGVLHFESFFVADAASLAVGARCRKSTYAWLTKKAGASIAWVGGGAEVVVDDRHDRGLGSPRPTPVPDGLTSARSITSPPSTNSSSVSGMLTVLNTSPGANVTSLSVIV